MSFQANSCGQWFKWTPVVLSALLLVGCRPSTVLSFPYMPGELDRAGYQALASSGWRTVEPMAADGVQLRGLVRAVQPTTDWVIFFGGNGEQLLRQSQQFLKSLDLPEQYALATFAYRGFDGVAGQPGPQVFVEDALTAVGDLRPPHSALKIHLVGYSMGSFAAGSLAARWCQQQRCPDSLVLLAPFTEIRIGDDHFDNGDWISALPQVKALVLHGEQDQALPLAQGRAVSQALSQARFVGLARTGHGEILKHPRVQESLPAFLMGVRPQ